jgi:hypothetical protein
MAFYHRAKSMYDRGEVVRAATILAEGLKREPGDVESLEWLLHLYVKEIPNPGLEVEMVKILAAQANGRDLLEIVQSELEAAHMLDKLKALDNVRRREGLLLDPPDPPSRKLGPTTPALRPLADPSSDVEVDDRGEPAHGAEPHEHDDPAESWKSFSDPSDEIAQVQARTPTPRITPVPSPTTVGEPQAERPAPRNSRPLPPLDDPTDDGNDDDDAIPVDSPRPVMTWVIVGVATALLVLALIMAIMRQSEVSDTVPSPGDEEGSGAAEWRPGPPSWSNA